MPEVPSAFLFLIFRAFIRIEKIEEEVRFCLVHALDRAFAVDLAHAADDLLDDSLGDHLVAGEDRRAETNMVHTGEQRDEASVFFRILERYAADLRHGFTDESARHDGMSREMSLEKWFIHGDGFHADRIVHRDQLSDLVDQEHRIAMRQDFHDFFYVEFHKCFLLENDGVLIDNRTIARRQRVSSKDRRGDSLLFLQSLQLFGQLGIQLVAAENGDDVRLKRAYEGNVA